MSDGEWERFYDLLRKIADNPNGSRQEKRYEMIRQAQRHGAGDALGEVLAWLEDDEPSDGETE